MVEERDPRNRYRNEESKEEEEENNEGDYEEVEENGRGALIGFLILFIILFLVSTGLLFYYQFYQGDDGWKFTFKKDYIGKSDVKDLEKEKSKLNEKVDTLESRLARKKQKIEELRQNRTTTSGSASAQKGGADISGIYYEVQIGAFRSFNFDKYGSEVTNLTFHNEGEMKKLALGKFKKPNAARAFVRDLNRIGLKDAFIVKKENGRRIEIIESY